jgi:uncharacterized membrane protein YgcG
MRRYLIKVSLQYASEGWAKSLRCVEKLLHKCTYCTFEFVNVLCGGVFLWMCSFSANRGSAVAAWFLKSTATNTGKIVKVVVVVVVVVVGGGGGGGGGGGSSSGSSGGGGGCSSG